jgi:hypothetical protein
MQRDPATWPEGYDEDTPPPAWLIGNGKAAHGLPSRQIGYWLQTFKVSGAPDFERAWTAAWGRCRWPQFTPDRRAWQRAVAWSRPWFERAWNGEPVPDAAMWEPVPDESRDPEHQRTGVLA